MELAWVALNYLGVEHTTTAATVRSVADIHLAYIPYSHSVVTVTAAALIVWWTIERGLGRRTLGRHLSGVLPLHKSDHADNKKARPPIGERASQQRLK